MAVLTYFVKNALHAGGVHQLMDESAPGANATATPGWTVAKLAAANYAHLDAGTKATSAAFNATVKPGATINTGAGVGNGFLSDQPMTGIFPSGNWTFTVSVIAATASTQRGAMRLRFYRCTGADGSGATAITPSSVVSGGTLSSSDVRMTPLAANLGAAQVDTTITVAMPQVSMVGEYLLIVAAWETTQAGGSNSADVLLRVGTTATRTVTTNFVNTAKTGGGSASASAGGSASALLEVAKRGGGRLAGQWPLPGDLLSTAAAPENFELNSLKWGPLVAASIARVEDAWPPAGRWSLDVQGSLGAGATDGVGSINSFTAASAGIRYTGRFLAQCFPGPAVVPRLIFYDGAFAQLGSADGTGLAGGSPFAQGEIEVSAIAPPNTAFVVLAAVAIATGATSFHFRLDEVTLVPGTGARPGMIAGGASAVALGGDFPKAGGASAVASAGGPKVVPFPKEGGARIGTSEGPVAGTNGVPGSPIVLPGGSSVHLAGMPHARPGPFFYGGNTYVAAVFNGGGNDDRVRIFKGAGGDPASFAGVDIANDLPGSTAVFGMANFAVVQRGSVLHVITQSNEASLGNLSYNTFDMATDSWGTPESLISSGTSSGQIDLCVRSTGEVVFAFHSSATVVQVYRRTGPGAVTQIGTAASSYLAGIVLGDADRVHVISTNSSNSFAEHRWVSVANVLSASSQIRGSSGNRHVARPVSVLDPNQGYRIIVGITDTQHYYVAELESRAAAGGAPTWRISADPLDSRPAFIGAPSGSVAAVASNGSNEFVAYGSSSASVGTSLARRAWWREPDFNFGVDTQLFTVPATGIGAGTYHDGMDARLGTVIETATGVRFVTQTITTGFGGGAQAGGFVGRSFPKSGGSRRTVTDYAAAVDSVATPLAHWRLDDATTTAVDRMGLSNGTYGSGVTRQVTGLLASDAGKAAYFSAAGAAPRGVAGVDEPALNFPAKAPWTLAMWIEPGSDRTNVFKTLFGKRVNGVGGYDIQYDPNPRTISMSYSNGATSSSVTLAGSEIPIGRFFFLASFDGTNVNVYVNGAFARTVAHPTWTASAAAWQIGGSSFDTGALDEVMVFGSALSAAQARALYVAGGWQASGGSPRAYKQAKDGGGSLGARAAASDFAALVNAVNPLAYWRLDDPTSTAVDEKGIANGTYQAGATRQVSGLLAADPNGAAQFDGTSGYVLGTDVDALDFPNRAPFTIGAVFQMDANASAGNKAIFSKAANASGGYFLYARNDGGFGLAVTDNTGSSSTTNTAAGLFTPGEKVAVFLTYTGSNYTLYVNNRVASLGNLANTTYTVATGLWRIGSTHFGTAQFPGKIDEVFVVGAALNGTQVRALTYAALGGGVAAGGVKAVAAAKDGGGVAAGVAGGTGSTSAAGTHTKAGGGSLAGVAGGVRVTSATKTGGSSGAMVAGAARAAAVAKVGGGAIAAMSGGTAVLSLALVKAGGAAAALVAGAARAALIARSGGGAAAAMAGGGQATIGAFSKAGGAAASMVAGGVKLVARAATGGGVAAWVAGGGKVVSRAGTGGAVAAASAGGSRVVSAPARTGGGSATATAGGSKLLSVTRTGGGAATGIAGGAKVASSVKTGGGVSVAAAGGSRAASSAKTGGASAVLSAGGTWVLSVLKPGGGVAPLSAGVSKVVSVSRAGGGVASGAAGGARSVSSVKAGGAMAALVAGASRVVSTVKAGGATASLLAGGGRLLDALKVGGGAAAASAGGGKVAAAARTGGGVAVLVGGGFTGSAQGKTGGGAIAGSAGGSRAVSRVYTGGGQAAAAAGGSRATVRAQTGGASATSVAGGTRLVGLPVRSGGAAAALAAGGTRMTLRAGAGGGQSSVTAGASKAVSRIATGGGVAMGRTGGSRLTSRAATGGGRANLVGGGSLPSGVLFVKTGGSSATLAAGGVWGVLRPKAGGGQASVVAGGARVELSLHTGGGAATGRAGASRDVTRVLSGGAAAAGSAGGSRATAVTATGGASAAFVGGGARYSEQAAFKVGGASATLRAGGSSVGSFVVWHVSPPTTALVVAHRAFANVVPHEATAAVRRHRARADAVPHAATADAVVD